MSEENKNVNAEEQLKKIFETETAQEFNKALITRISSLENQETPKKAGETCTEFIRSVMESSSPAIKLTSSQLLTFEQYSQVARSTAIYPPERGLEYCTLGLLSEAGEIAGKLKKAIRDNNGVLTDEAKVGLRKEGGDCLWYLSEIALLLGTTLAEMASDNNKKLLDRQARNVLGGSGDNR